MKFKSIKKGDKIAYIVTTGSSDTPMHYYSNPYNYIGSSILCYDTYGDGMTQHSPSYCASKDLLEDFLISFAIFLNDNPDEVENIDLFLGGLFECNEDQVRFFEGLKYNPDVTVYYNKSELKTSKSSKKEYDKRWEKIPSWADGTMEAVLSFMAQSYWGTLKRFACLDNIKPILNYSWYDFEKHFNIKTPSNSFSMMINSLNVIKAIWKSYRHKDYAKRSMENLKYNLEREKETQ